MPPVLKTTRPRIEPKQARDLLRDHYGLENVELSELPSERDQNFRVEAAGTTLVLKIANASESAEILDFQNRALLHVQEHATDLPVPRLRVSRDGGLTAALPGGNLCRLLDFLEGRPLAKYKPHDPTLLRSIGRFIGRLDRALEGFRHDAESRTLYWDTKKAPSTIRDGLDLIEDPIVAAFATRTLAAVERDLVPRLEELPRGIIHNDANDYNVLVADGQMSGLLDFGDIVSSCLVFEVANAVAYCMLSKHDPLPAAAAVVAGYHEARPLTEDELLVLDTAVRARLAMSAAVGARQSHDEPDEGYLSISQKPVRDLIEKLEGYSPELCHYTFRDACGLPAHPSAPAVSRWLAARSGQVLPFELRSDAVHRLDLSIGSLELGGLDVVHDVERFTEHVFATMRRAGARVGVGRYDEARPIYTSASFRPEPGAGFETRTIHLGVDLFVDAGTPVRAPLDGAVHSFQLNDGPLDYGPTILLEHEVRLDPASDEVTRFYTLYGHLSEGSLEGLDVGARIAEGEVFAKVGDASVNGGWPPHLHLQVALDLLGFHGDFPGVCRPSERSLWLGLCPDPSSLAGLSESAAAPRPADKPELIDARRRSLSPNLSLSYREPLHILRGFGAYLYDEAARPYLDMVNNVCHVGHCRPEVVRAAQEQVAVLNTNTRYLHDNVLRYAERLTATLPEHLEVCFFVNSGSEANDLALRLARAHTGRLETLVLEGAYHGHVTSLIEVSPYKFDRRGGSGAPPHVHKLAMPDGYRGRYRAEDADYAAHYLSDAAETVEALKESDRPVGALIAESILSCGGQIVHPPGYLRELGSRVQDAGGIVICDEVQVGFGRVGSRFWAFQAEDARPDIVTLGKPAGNGHPLAAVVTTRAIADSFDNGMEYFNTFGGNPVSCAIGLAVLDVIEQEDLQARAESTGQRLVEGLRELMTRHPIVGDVRGRGLFLGFELVEDPQERTPAASRASDLVQRLRAEGILNSTDGPDENVIKIKPPLVFSPEHADYYLETLDEVLSEDRFRL